MVVRLHHTKPQPLACDREWVQRILPFLFHQSQSRAPDSVWKHLRKVWGVGRSFHQRFNQDWRLIKFFWRKNVIATSRQTRLSSTIRLLMFKTKPQPCLGTREGHQPKFSRWQWQWWETVVRTFIDRLQTKRRHWYREVGIKNHLSWMSNHEPKCMIFDHCLPSFATVNHFPSDFVIVHICIVEYNRMPSSINKWHIHHDKSIFTIADNVLSVYHMISKVVIHYVQSRSDIIIFKYIC